MKQPFSFKEHHYLHHKVKACPTSFEQVNKNLIKAYSSIVFIILIYTFATGKHWAMYLISLDFLIRVFAGIKYSPLCNFLMASLKITPLKPVLINAASKKIAAQVGLLFCIMICVFHWIGLPVMASIFTILFALAIFLDLFFEYCLACKLQSIYLTYKSKFN